MSATSLRTRSGVDAQVEGDGPPVVLVAGFGQNGQVWSSTVRRLRDRFTCVTLDNRGMPGTEERGRVSIDAMADDVAQVIDHLGRPASVVGWSMGGAVAQTVALEQPDALTSLVLVSSTARRSDVQHAWLEARLALMQSDLPPEVGELMALPWLFSARVVADQPRALSIARSNAATSPSLAGLRAQSDALASFDVLARLSDVTVPTLVLVGIDDLVTPAAESIEIARRIRGAELVVLQHGGHAVVLEDPAEVVAPVLRFLTRHAAVTRVPSYSLTSVRSH